MTTFQKIIKYLAIAFAIFLIVNIISAIMFGIYKFANVLGLTKTNQEDSEILNKQEMILNTESKDISNLNISLKYSNLVIKKSDKFLAESNNKNVSCIQENNSLEIKESDYNNFKNNQTSEVTIYIPENLIFKTINIEAGAGKIYIDTLNAENLLLEIGAGKTEIENINVTEKAKLDGGAGKVDILNGTINNLNLDMGVGKFAISTKLKGKNKINAGIGKLDVNLQDSIENYSIKAYKGVGTINIDGKSISDNEEYGIGENYIKLDGGIGSIDIRFVNK